MAPPLGITDVVLRDAHQSILATRLRIDDMLPICDKLDRVGFWSLETWGGATFDACIRYLGEGPWERLRALKQAMPRTPQQMLFRGQNILGYRHYADDVVEAFVTRAADNGIDVFRIFDAMNDIRNMKQAIRATLAMGKHAQGTLSYTVSPVHTMDMWVDLAKGLEDLGPHSICIKDMAGLLRPYDAEEVVGRLKQALAIPVHMQCHATTGLSTATIIKAAEAGIDNVDTAISSMRMTYGHSPTETIVAALEGADRDTRLDLNLLEQIAQYFREVRKKYARFEGSLKGVDARILVAQVPGGMLTNMENQLKEQGATDRFDAVLEEIPKVREDLGYIPLVTPTSQIVGTQAVINVLQGERYKTITKETAGVLKGEYGATPAAVSKELRNRVLEDAAPITCRPADLLQPEMDRLTAELHHKAKDGNVALAKDEMDDVLTYALFPQVGLKFLQNRGNPSAFEPPPGIGEKLAAAAPPAAPGAAAQFGIFSTLLGALVLNVVPGLDFSVKDAAAIAIIGGADGPTAIYVGSKLAPDLLGAIAVAAYSYMALVPLIHPPIMRLLTTEQERNIEMQQLRVVGSREKILFPIVLVMLCAFLLPSAAPLIGMFCLGNLMTACGAVERLSKTSQNELINIVTILLGLSVGSKLSADAFLSKSTLGILMLGMIAFCIGTAAGVLMAKLMNLFIKTPINPLIGAAGVSAVPMAARVANKVGLENNPHNFLLMHAMGPNVAGVIGSAVAAGILISLVGR